MTTKIPRLVNCCVCLEGESGREYSVSLLFRGSSKITEGSEYTSEMISDMMADTESDATSLLRFSPEDSFLECNALVDDRIRENGDKFKGKTGN